MAGCCCSAAAPRTALTAYRPALALITGIAAAGALVAISGLRPRRAVAPEV